MRWIIVSLAVALAASAAWAQGQAQQPEQSADPHAGQSPDEEQGLKSYGYGEQPGTEARSESRQSSERGRARSGAPQDERRDGAAARGKERTVTGRVVSATARSLSLRGDDRRVHELSVTRETQVLRGGQRVEVGDLRRGEEVRASFDVQGARRVARRISVGEDASRAPPSEVKKGREDEQRMRGGAGGGAR